MRIQKKKRKENICCFESKSGFQLSEIQRCTST